MTSDSHQEANRLVWDERAPAHAASPTYNVDAFSSDPSAISDVVRVDLPRLGDITGLRGVHLQCHIGTDTVSLSRLGAQKVGIDFSPAAVGTGEEVATSANADVEFVECDVYAAPERIGKARFDLVFTGIGALCWLPDVSRWAQVVADLLVPGGRLFIREGHPMLWTLADARADGVLAVEHAYFELAEPEVFVNDGTYVETDAQFEHSVTHEWNHGIGETVTALMAAGMDLTMLEEHDSAPWEALDGQMEQIALGEWRLMDRPWRLPHTYTLQAVKRR